MTCSLRRLKAMHSPGPASFLISLFSHDLAHPVKNLRFKPRFMNRLKTRKAFSLVEVTIAMGVMAFAAITIMALIPNGLTAASRSSHTTVAARLAAEVQSEIQQVGLASFPTDTTYFDADGKILPNSTTEFSDPFRRRSHTWTVIDYRSPDALQENVALGVVNPDSTSTRIRVMEIFSSLKRSVAST